MPKLWSDTIEAHRHEVRGAIMETTWQLAADHGPMSITMSQIAQETGIGRATLYKYFPDVETILHAKHEERVLDHLMWLNELRDRTDDPRERLEAVAQAYAQICHQRAKHGTIELSALTHQTERVNAAEKELHALFQEVIADAMAAGAVRASAKAGELAIYCVHALGAASSLSSEAAAHRLVAVVLSALRP